MAVITLTSDMGITDYYVGTVKGAILAQAPNATIVDISHHIRPFDIHHAAYVLRSSWQHFPMGSIHMIGVRPQIGPDSPHVVVHYMSHYFISADNGVFSLLFDEQPEDIIEINLHPSGDWSFPMRGTFATVAAHLARGGKMDLLGRRTNAIKTVNVLQPFYEDNILKASVVHTDHYGNVFTNIRKDFFDSARAGRSFKMLAKKASFGISKISNDFGEVIRGECLAMFASNGYLMIAMNESVTNHGGGAQGLLGLKHSDTIFIEFYD